MTQGLSARQIEDCPTYLHESRIVCFVLLICGIILFIALLISWVQIKYFLKHWEAKRMRKSFKKVLSVCVAATIVTECIEWATAKALPEQKMKN